MIAVTEVTRAFAEGNEAAWRTSKVVEKKEWMTAFDEIVCPICGPLSGMIVPINESFGRINKPPAHPRCRCYILPVVAGDDEVLSPVGLGPWSTGGAGPASQINRGVASPFLPDNIERIHDNSEIQRQDDIALAWRENLTDEQGQLIRRWQSSKWATIKDAYETGEASDITRAFEQTLNSAPITKGTLWRGINVGPGSQFNSVDDILNHYRRASGTTVEWISPASTTLRPRVASQFSNGVVFEIQPKTARGIGGHFLAESVTLPGTKYRVLRVSDARVFLDGEERWVIQLIEE